MVQGTQRVAGCSESRAMLPGTQSTQRPREELGEREGGTGKGDGSGEAAPGSDSRTPAGPVHGPPLSPASRPGSSPAARPRRGPRHPVLPRVRSSGTFSSPLSFRPARNRHIAPIRIRGQASGGSPGSSQSPGLLFPSRARGRQVPGVASAGRLE